MTDRTTSKHPAPGPLSTPVETPILKQLKQPVSNYAGYFPHLVFLHLNRVQAIKIGGDKHQQGKGLCRIANCWLEGAIAAFKFVS